MAITKIGVYRNPPEDITDFQGISELLMAYARDLGGQGMILTEWTNTNEWPKLAMGTYLFHGGASYVVDTEDHEIGEPADGTYYLRIAASGETLAVSWISSLTGYAWNPIYNGLYHADQSQILPYQLVVAGASREKWKITNLAQGGGFITANWEGRVRMESVNTGQGDFKIGQNLRPTDAVEFAKGVFATLNTGHGDFEIGQNLRTTDPVEFATIDTGFGANKVYRETYQNVSLTSGVAQSITLDSMPYSGETKYCYLSLNSGASGVRKRLYLPSGGTYFVQGWQKNSDADEWRGLSSRAYIGIVSGIVSGGASIIDTVSIERISYQAMLIIRKI